MEKNMNKIEYGGVYFIDNPIGIGKIYLRFFRNGKIAYSIISDLEKHENMFNLLQKNYNTNIDLVKYNINNNIEFSLNTKIGILQLSGNINDDNLVMHITNTTSVGIIAKDMIFTYYKNVNTKIKNNEKINVKIISCEFCSGTEFFNYRIFNEQNKFILFKCKKCKTVFIYKNNTINIYKDIKKEENNKEYIPGSPQMARSYNGCSYNGFARWGNRT
jgi:hypothetical protein